MAVYIILIFIAILIGMAISVTAFGTGGKRAKIFKDIYFSVEDVDGVGVLYTKTGEYSAILAKKALCRDLSRRNENPFYADMEQKMLDKINKLGIGSQGFGGTVTALYVNIEKSATHIAGLPVAVNIGCHVTRHAHEVI